MSHQRQQRRLVQLATNTLMARRQGCRQLHARRRCKQQTALLTTDNTTNSRSPCHHFGSYVSRRSIASSSSSSLLSLSLTQRSSFLPSSSYTYCHWSTNDFKRGRCRNVDETEIQFLHQRNHHHLYHYRLLNHHHPKEQQRYYQSRTTSSEESSTTTTLISTITERDIEELYKCMNERPGSLLTTGVSGGGGVCGDGDDLSKYNTDWTVSSIRMRIAG